MAWYHIGSGNGIMCPASEYASPSRDPSSDMKNGRLDTVQSHTAHVVTGNPQKKHLDHLLHNDYNYVSLTQLLEDLGWPSPVATLIAKFMGPTWGPSGADRTQVGPMLTPWTLLSGQTSRGKVHPGPSFSKFEPPCILPWWPWSHPDPHQDSACSGARNSLSHNRSLTWRIKDVPLFSLLQYCHNYILKTTVFQNIFCLVLTACIYSLKLATNTNLSNIACPNHAVVWTAPYECTALGMTFWNQHT